MRLRRSPEDEPVHVDDEGIASVRPRAEVRDLPAGTTSGFEDPSPAPRNGGPSRYAPRNLMPSCARLVALISLVSLASLIACASPAPPPSAPASADPPSTAPTAKPSPNDCGAPGSARPCAGPTGEPKEPVRKMCTDMACLDGVTIVHRLAGAELAKGKHTFEIEADGAKATCSVVVNDLGADAQADCADRFSLSIAPKSETTVVPPKAGAGPDAPVMATRTVVPNSTEWRIHLEGKTPKALRIVHKLGTKTVADHKLAPKYEQRQPNGKGCEPTCSQANETVP